MSISTLSFNSATRASILRIQSELRDAEKEISTLRHADVGRTLGRLTGDAVSFRSQETSIDRVLESNKLVASRLTLMENALESVAEYGDEVLGGLINGTKTGTSTATLVEQAELALGQFTGALNISASGQYLFSGTQSDVRPLKDGSAAVATAFGSFLAAAGPDPLTPATGATVTGAQMQAYLSDAGFLGNDGVVHRFSDAFSDASWGAEWSDASDTPAEARISKTETIVSSLSANERALRDVAAAYSMISELGLADLGETARQAVVSAASTKMKAGLDGITELRAEVGVRQKRVEIADAALTQQKDIVHAAFERLESVDLTEASLRITRLETQLEASYTITGRLQNLNILNYL